MEVEQSGRLFAVSFGNGCVIRVSRVRELPSGDFRGLLELANGDVPLHTSTANLSTASGRQSIARSMNGKQDEWLGMLDAACSEVVRRLHKGEPLQTLRTDAKIPPMSHLLAPLIVEGVPNILFGDGASFKSYLALTFVLCCQIPLKDNSLGLTTKATPTTGLYLDFETDFSTVNRRLQRLQRGMGLSDISLHYRRCFMPLQADLEAVQAYLMETKAQFLVIDSLALAAGGDLKEVATATNFFQALRQLGSITSLLVTHVSKDTLAKTRTPFGSVYFSNLARQVVEVKKLQDVGQSEISLALHSRKSNDDALFHPLGFRVTFDNQATTISRQDIRELPELGQLPLRERIIDLLGSGPLPAPEIAKQLGEKPDAIRARLNDHKTIFIKLDQGWGLRSNEQ